MADPLTIAAIGWGLSVASWVLSPIFSRLLNKCFDALGLDPRFQSRKEALDKKLEDLQTTLLPHLLILTDVTRGSPHRPNLQAWLQKLKSAYYEAEHLLGLVEYKRLEKEVNSLFPSTSEFAPKSNSMELRKDNLIKSLDNLEKIVNEAMKLAPVLNQPTNSTVNNSTPRHSEYSSEIIYKPGFTVIGRDNDRDNVVKLLMEDLPKYESNANCFSVIGIWGMAGSGKTTLARYVYEYLEKATSDKKTNYFDTFIWVDVSQNFSVKSIFERIWESAFEEPCPNFKSTAGLRSKLKEKLKGRRFLLVLDDVWCDQGINEQQCQQLLTPLQDAESGSKVLVTTRVERTAKTLGAMKPIRLRQLDHNEFLELFMSHALSGLQNKHLVEKLKPIGQKIAVKLHRSPLAASTVAAQLNKRQEPHFWLSMLKRNLLKETMGALFLSYQHLPPPLQRCFAICSLFPKGYQFDHNYLVSLWIAEGFIETKDSNEHVRDISDGYITELISSSFLQVSRSGDNKYIIHDLLHDLAENVSKGECFRIEGGEKREIPTHIRHLFVEANMFEKYVRRICELKNLCTIIIMNSSNNNLCLKEEHLNALFMKSKKFYVVDLQNNFVEGVPESVVYLENLRYLNCGHVSKKKFPKSLNRLYQLRVLLGYCDSNLLAIPDIGRLILLQELKEFKVRKESAFGLNQLEHLRDLSGGLVISDLHNVRSSEEARRLKLSDKEGLRTLKLCWSYADTDVRMRYRDAEILDELQPPPQIKELIVENYNGERYPSWISEYNNNTAYLEILKLCNCPSLEALPEINKCIFLDSLTIDNLPIKRWGPLPLKLAILKLHRCFSLAFAMKEELEMMMMVKRLLQGKKIMSTISKQQSQIDIILEKFGDGSVYCTDLDKQKMLDDHIYLPENVNEELYLPHTLNELSICLCFITDKILARSLQDLTSLTRLYLQDIIPIKSIPQEVLGSLINLLVLSIKRCVMLASIGGLDNLSSLEEITIDCCPCLTIGAPLGSRSSNLRKVILCACMPLDSMFKDLVSVQRLQIQNCPTIESPDFGHSKSLFSLSVEDCVNLISLRGLNELNNLEYLNVAGCHNLQCSSDASKLPRVRELTITKVSMLQLISREGFSSLVSLTLCKAQQEYFTREECQMLSHLSSLETIRFQYCKMQSLPNLLCLRSPTKFEISNCQNLTSLSEVPPSVKSIRISSCNAEFIRSCKDARHPNWQKISHIPTKHFSKNHDEVPAAVGRTMGDS